ncbi:NAD-dependent epimerase/dehydratase family protein [Lysobacter enzymogenes]|uniref:NAD-dependent epimerase/dehydratase n=1 Tax=Lysobacter enzymogenes TaxID=69 RepID=A0AAU9AS54_LYSEN|nr:NAD-dependent epimerase/dehydratase family protein [Lysobacter enzymogenes]BAV98289.1 NAD-dependent epimerase/dehydratase [Lysobacter enzymogenes]
MKVFITGANGFVGLNIVSALLEAGHEPTAIVRPGSNTTYLEPFGIRVVRGGLDDSRALAEAMRGAEAVVHTAGNTSCNWRDLPQLQAVNVDGTRNVADAALAAGVRRLVFTSTTSTIGADNDPSRRADEREPLRGFRARSPYGRTKAQAERIVADAAAKGLETIVLNPAEVLGAYDYNLQWGRIVLAAHYDQIPFDPPGGASFCHAADVGRAHVAALTRGRPGERYLLAGHDLRFSEFFDAAGEALGKRLNIPSGGYRWLYYKTWLQEKAPALMPGEPVLEAYRLRVLGGSYYFDSSKAERELGYRSAPVQRMLESCAQWYRKHGFLG